MKKISLDALNLVCEFPFADDYENRDLNHEIATFLGFKRGAFHHGYRSDELTKKYDFLRIRFLSIELPNNILVSFNYNNHGNYLVFLAKENKVFEYRNHQNEAWINRGQFRSYEGLNALYAIQEFLKGVIVENLQEVTKGFAFESCL